MTPSLLKPLSTFYKPQFKKAPNILHPICLKKQQKIEKS
ncbi:hypothetical protein ELI_2382 [Eubacterium callanderi]|uniref:Uncharacterized protein n=1 Tax=Eubacterium callanderi TaxID=53442 RepID=E3GDY2_9FIRM|nr:hypothetical protein ELI_2382 [Eubacterium callanderi]